MEQKNQEIDSGFMINLMVELTKKTVTNENIHKMLTDPKEHFDVAIVEWLFCDALAG